jgi:hypothetical protein
MRHDGVLPMSRASRVAHREDLLELARMNLGSGDLPVSAGTLGACTCDRRRNHEEWCLLRVMARIWEMLAALDAEE